jgi:Omp85 superfamily domain/Surface antigen variable number repeat
LNHSKTYLIRKLAIATAMAFCFFMVGCRQTKRLADGEYLLDKNKIVTDIKDIDFDELESIIKQKPNRKIIIGRFHLWVFNIPDPAKMQKRMDRKETRVENRNEKRIKKGKKPKAVGRTTDEWLREVVGEAPVVVDSALVEKSREQLQLFLFKKGWFNNIVTDTIVYGKRKKAKVTYIVNSGTPYTIDTITTEIYDQYLRLFTASIADKSILKIGDQFSIENLEQERKRLTDYYKNNGYFTFNKEFILFKVDTGLANYKVALKLSIIALKKPYELNTDSLITINYPKFKINDIVMNTNFTRSKNVALFEDTVIYKGYQFLNYDSTYIKPKILAQSILFEKDQTYSLDKVNRTYRKLSILPIFNNINIQFVPVSASAENTLLNCFINTSQTKKQSFGFETRGTNRGGFLGISGTLSYQNKNIFKGAESLEINLLGGGESQPLLTQQDNIDQNTQQIADGFTLNTFEFGPEVVLNFQRIPKFFFFNPDRIRKTANPKLVLRTAVNFQQRPDYKRSIVNLSLGIEVQQNKYLKYIFTLAELSVIKINKSNAFEERLLQLNDKFLQNSYQDHFISNFRASLIFNNQDGGKRNKIFYYKGDFEPAGLLLRASKIIQDKNFNLVEPDSLGSYQAFNIRFSHYLKTVHDFRYYYTLNEKHSIVYRVMGGIAVPLKNLNAIPFERSFFAGGANGNRAWQARTLGPGAYFDPNNFFDKIGDIQLEGNIEYRFKLISPFEGALFTDVGNIWVLNEDNRPGSQFKPDKFLGEIAVGGGIGLRVDFGFFIIRLDVATQIKNPELPIGERWLFQSKEAYNKIIDTQNLLRPEDAQLGYFKWTQQFNLGIAYPF